jgi:signal-transduction protein with cAMP-binding, CBS, and nucleotidyltransferase domain
MVITLRVKDVMDKKVVHMDARASVAEVIKRMVADNVWSLVVDRRGLPEGVVTERDVLRRCLAKGLVSEKTPAEKIMSSPLITIGPEATIREAMGLMVQKDIRRLFVVEDGKIIGRVTQTELFDSTVDVLGSLSSLSSRL